MNAAVLLAIAGAVSTSLAFKQAADSGGASSECLIKNQAVPLNVDGPTHFSLLHPTPSFEFVGGVTNSGLLRQSYHPPRNCSKAVEKNTHTIWIGKPLPKKYAENLAAIANKNPAWTVMLWIDHPLRPRVAKYLDTATRNRKAGAVVLKDVVAESSRFRNWDLVQKEGNLAGKSDYLRLEVVYLYGGIYMDTDTKIVHGFDEYGSLFRWPWVTGEMNTGYKNACNCAFGFERGSGFLQFALEATRENCLKFNTCGVMSGAGPGFLTGALNRWQAAPDILLFNVNNMLHPDHKGNNVIYQTFDATWLKKTTHLLAVDRKQDFVLQCASQKP